MSINKKYISLIIVMVACLLSACEQGKLSGKGLYLPKGNIDEGKTAFIDLNCHQCHTVANVELPAFAPETPLISLHLGGELYRVKTYGELITAIINPNHIISAEYLQQLSKFAQDETSQSPMISFNDEMTVTQLINIVTFLNAQYTELHPNYRN